MNVKAENPHGIKILLRESQEMLYQVWNKWKMLFENVKGKNSSDSWEFNQDFIVLLPSNVLISEF